jgi:very-short-patch-repair endonuclease
MTTTADDTARQERTIETIAPLAFARRLRRDMTIPERKLWQALRTRRAPGLHFRRQVPMGSFILDFFDAAHKLAVEVDGAA